MTFNMFGVNTYILWDETSAECAIIDPGMMSHFEEDRLSQFIESPDI